MKEGRRFARNATWIIIGNVLHTFIAFVIGIYSARYLGPSNYGLLSYSSAIIGIFSAFAALGFSNTIIKFLVEDPDNQGDVMGTAVFFRFVASMISSVAVMITIMILRPKDHILMIVSLFQSIGMIFQSWGIITQWFQSRLQSRTSSLIALTSYFLTSMYKLWLLIHGKSVEWFAFASVIEYVTTAILLYVFYKLNHGAGFHISMKRGFGMVKESYHFIISNLMVLAYTQMDRLMLSTMLGDMYTGNYSVAITLCDAWTFILGALIDSASPLIYQAHKDKSPNYIRGVRQLNSAIIFIAGIAALLISLLSKHIISILYGHEYELAAGPLTILSWYSLFQYLGRIRPIWATCEGLQKYEKYLSAIGLAGNAFLNYVLINAMGMNGAAWATLITQIFTNVIVLYFFKDLRPYAKILKDAFLFRDVLTKDEFHRLFNKSTIHSFFRKDNRK